MRRWVGCMLLGLQESPRVLRIHRVRQNSQWTCNAVQCAPRRRQRLKHGHHHACRGANRLQMCEDFAILAQGQDRECWLPLLGILRMRARRCIYDAIMRHVWIPTGRPTYPTWSIRPQPRGDECETEQALEALVQYLEGGSIGDERTSASRVSPGSPVQVVNPKW